MSSAVRFSPELGRWLTEAMARNQPPAAMIQTLSEGGMEGWVARGIVEAFVAARRAGQPLPASTVVLEDDAPAFVREPPRLPSGPRITTHDRVVPVLARSESPILALLGDLMSADECRALIALARLRLRPSTVVDPASGQDVVAQHRSSLGMFFRPGETPLIARLDRRLSDLMSVPLENGEGFQILYYPPGALSTAHFDFLVPSNAANRASIARSGQRLSTVVTYLNDVERGGETMFPRAGWTIAPQQGNAVYFEYCNSHGQVDHQSLHAGNPVLVGEKWVATKWARQRAFVSAGAERSAEVPAATIRPA